jgi:DNA repair protein RecO (recombination protein O)
MPALPTVTHLAALLTCDWTTALQADPRTRREATGLIAAFFTYHQDHQLRSLPHLDLTH